MGDIFTIISNNIIEFISTIITAVIGYLGLRIKKIYQEYVNDKIKKDIIEKTVNYVEQVGKTLTCEEKKQMVKEKALKWLEEKKITISDTELEIIIESAVKCL